MILIKAELTGKQLLSLIDQPVDQDEVRFWWLGQAGFAFRHKNFLVLIDPYLSDSLAEKYKHSELKHLRMMPVPLPPEMIRGCNGYLCTHGHTDHMDPLTIRLIQQHSTPYFVIPRAEIERGLERGIPPDRLKTIDTGETLELAEGISVEAVAAAHERLEVDNAGYSKYLGYVISISGLRLYHSGDCIPYPGLIRTLLDRKIDLAFLPINGRDEYRLSRGIPGNFTLEEAVELCKAAQIPHLVCHHFGMFSFNTIDRQTAQKKLHDRSGSLAWVLPEIGVTYHIVTDQKGT